MTEAVNLPLPPPPYVEQGYSQIACNLLSSGGILFLRALSMQMQMIGKRLIYAKTDESLLEAFAGIAAIEDLIFIFAFSALGYLSTRIAQCRAEREVDDKKIGQLFRSGLLFTAGLVGLAGILCVLSTSIYRVFEQPDVVVNNSWPYFRVAFFAYLFDFLYRCEVRAAIGLSAFLPPLIADIAEGILDLLLTYYFVMQRNMGLAGSALAYALSALVTLIGFTVYLNKNTDFKKYHLFDFAQGMADTNNIVVRGLQNGCSAALEYLAQFLMIFYAGGSGTDALLGMQAASAYSLSVTLPVGALSEAGSVYVGSYFETNNPLFRLYGHASIAASVFYAGFCGLLFNGYPRFFASLFLNSKTSSPSALNMLIKFMRIQSIIELLNGARISAAGMLSACNLTGFSFSVNILFVFLLNAIFATLAHFAFKTSADTTYATQISGFFLATLAIKMSWYLQDKTPSSTFTKAFQSVDRRCNAFWNPAKEAVRNNAIELPQVVMAV